MQQPVIAAPLLLSGADTPDEHVLAD